MSVEMEYKFLEYDVLNYSFNVVINKNQTLLALNIFKKIDIFSMETGVWISRYDLYNSRPIEFVILDDGCEGLIIEKYSYKFLDSFHPSDAIDITNDIGNVNINVKIQNIITKSNKKISIIENNVWVTDALKENTFQQMLNTTYHSNIYTLSTFKTIRRMLEDSKDNTDDIERDKDNIIVFPEDNMIKLGGELFQFEIQSENNWFVELFGIKKSQNNKWEKIQKSHSLYGFGYNY
ncbi:hypothetical protein C1645_734921 [Glomus cerebriforme]|uniref:Uncharacterized protein n=1 Tax=Glomus cerebriforme TaxID=658196 RepID=A0A397TAB0_9GLOM|nr:hypothetical protein C1645_734921 [Glomus cerebriforme]